MSFVTPRKEVIQPLLPERLPCYDLALIADLTLGGFVPCGFKTPTSGPANFAHLTGGVYKERERIHRSLLTCDYYRFRLHEGELQPSIRTEEGFKGLAQHYCVATRCPSHCITCVAQGIKGHADLASSSPSSPLSGY